MIHALTMLGLEKRYECRQMVPESDSWCRAWHLPGGGYQSISMMAPIKYAIFRQVFISTICVVNMLNLKWSRGTGSKLTIKSLTLKLM